MLKKSLSIALIFIAGALSTTALQSVAHASEEALVIRNETHLRELIAPIVRDIAEDVVEDKCRN